MTFREAKEEYMIARVRNWATDCIRDKKSGNLILNQIKIEIDKFGKRPIPLTQEERKRFPDYAKHEDEESAMPIHFDLQAGNMKCGNGRLVACNNEYEGAQEVVDAFRWCLRETNQLPPIDDLQLTQRETKQLCFDF